MKKICFVFAFFFLNALFAAPERELDVQAEKQVEKDVHRIMKLLPNLKSPLLVKPFIPDNFVLVKQTEDPIEEYFWGPEGIFEAYINNPSSIAEPFLHIIPRKGMKEEDMKTVVKEMRDHFPENFESSNFRWGPYPVTAIKFMMVADPQYFAYVILNDSEGTALIFHLIYSQKLDFGNGNIPSKKDLIFWNNFLKNTKPLIQSLPSH